MQVIVVAYNSSLPIMHVFLQYQDYGSIYYIVSIVCYALTHGWKVATNKTMMPYIILKKGQEYTTYFVLMVTSC